MRPETKSLKRTISSTVYMLFIECMWLHMSLLLSVLKLFCNVRHVSYYISVLLLFVTDNSMFTIHVSELCRAFLLTTTNTTILKVVWKMTFALFVIFVGDI